MPSRFAISRACVALLAASMGVATLAQAPAVKAPAGGTVASGQAAGTLTAKGKTVKLAYAAAFVDQTDKKKPIVLLVTEQPVPSASWRSHSDLMTYHRNTAPIVGVVFRLDANREIDTAEYFVEKFPTSTSGMFQLSLDGAPGKAISGTLKSSAAAAKMSEPVSLAATFNAPLK
jgi:hypothetical protein